LVISITLLTFSNSYASDINTAANVIRSYCSENIGLINFKIENDLDEWIEIDSVSVSFVKPSVNSEVVVLTGDKLIAWYNAMIEKGRNSQLSRGMYGGLTLKHLQTGGASKSPNTASASEESILTVNAIKPGANFSGIIPESHVLSVPFLIPPKLTISKWIVFQTPKRKGFPYLEIIEIGFYSDGKELFKRELAFRETWNKKNICIWQSKVAPRL
jgi:hypothetical protein